MGNAAACKCRQHLIVESTEAGVVVRDAVAIVASERLVTPLASQHHFHMLRRQHGNEIERNTGRVSNGLIFVPHQTGQLAEELFGADHDFAVLRLAALRHHARIHQLIGFALCKGHRKGLDGILHQASHRGSDCC